MVAGMVEEDLGAEQGGVEVEVDFGGGDGFVAEHLLDGAEVGAPSRRWVAKLWRRVCGEMVLRMSAFRARRRMIVNIIWRVRREPRRLRKSMLSSPGFTSTLLRASRIYSRMRSMATSDIGTTRCLLPLPSTMRYCSWRYTLETSRLTSSETRSPHP